MAVPNARRNRLVTHRVLQGETCEAVAEDYGLTSVRVHQIVHHTCQVTARPYHTGRRSLRSWRWWYRQHPEALGMAPKEAA